MSQIPNLNVAESKKDKAWIKEIALYLSKSGVTMESKKIDGEYWRYYNNEFPKGRFNYFLKFGNHTLPAKPRHIPLQRHLIDLLISELTTRPREFKVTTIDEESVDAKYEAIIKGTVNDLFDGMLKLKMASTTSVSTIEQKIDQVQQLMQQEPQTEEEALEVQRMKAVLPGIIAQMQSVQMKAVKQEDVVNDLIQDVEMYYGVTYKEYKEEIAESILKNLYRNLKIRQTEKKSFRTKTVTGKQAYYVDQLDDERHPRFEALHDMKLYYPYIDGVERINKGPWVVVSDYMSPQQVIIEFGHEMNPKQRNNILKKDTSSQSERLASTPDGGIETPYSGKMYTSGVRIDRVFFKSPRKEEIKFSPNPHSPGDSFIHILDPYTRTINADEYKYDKKKKIYINIEDPRDWVRQSDVQAYSLSKGDVVEDRWTNDIYEAVVIDSEIVVKARKKKFTPRSVDRHSDVNLPVFGPTEYPYSLIGATLDMQKLYDVLYTQLELMVALAGTRSVFIDKSQKPDGMTDQQWEYQKKMGNIYVQSMTKQGQPRRTNFNQWTSVDLSLSNGITYLKDILDRLEESMGTIIGIPRQRQAQVKDTDQVGTFKESIKRSYLITEVLFSDHEDVLGEALTQLVTLAGRYAYKNGGRVEMNEHNLGRKILNIDPETFTDVDLRVTIERSSDNVFRMDELRQLAGAHYKAGQLPFESLVEIYTAENLSELAHKVKYFAEKAEKLQAQIAQAEAQNQEELELKKIQYMNEFNAFWKQQELQIEKEKNQVDFGIQQTNAMIEERRLQLDAAIAESNAKLKLFELVNEKESEDNAVKANDRANMINSALKELEIKLNYLINTGNMMLQKDKNEKDHTENMKKLSNDTVKKTMKEHVSDK